MALLFLDLDNTLLDRDGAFRSAAVAFLAEHGLPSADVEWLASVDASGYTLRSVVGDALLERHPSLSAEEVQRFLDNGAAEHVRLADRVRRALRRATEAGWTCVVVTNGRTRQQERKLAVSGLDREVSGWAVSQAVGHRKPEREIFAAAAASVGARLEDGGWVVGDSPHADIAGADRLGLPSVWLHLGRQWPADLPFKPTHIADDLPSALDHLLRG
ncbi:HAD family hydrolase [Actinopolymorpha rutila]|uniref:Putative hydrolase of the HAD superfamily n=1 Tax=Actinopolymorpha rutila TaxID=446787 RepID=A0A852ZEK7_9ACTN|nr:HAD family hydrolase [Actinopolymorpha rutila]NYH90152.1 putative hydrolase of the HAD superfamily [Actinopolymorpha rutila]